MLFWCPPLGLEYVDWRSSYIWELCVVLVPTSGIITSRWASVILKNYCFYVAHLWTSWNNDPPYWSVLCQRSILLLAVEPIHSNRRIEDPSTELLWLFIRRQSLLVGVAVPHHNSTTLQHGQVSFSWKVIKMFLCHKIFDWYGPFSQSRLLWQVFQLVFLNPL